MFGQLATGQTEPGKILSCWKNLDPLAGVVISK
jgi:hypothetical protein